MSIPGEPRIFIRPRTDNGSISFYWNAPDSDGGSTITSYLLDCPNDPSAPYTIAPTRYTFDVSGLFNTVQYTYTIAAVNGIGTGPAATYRTVRPNMNEFKASDFTMLGQTGGEFSIQYFQPDPCRPGTYPEQRSYTPFMTSGRCKLSSTGAHIAVSATMPNGVNISHTKGASWSNGKFLMNTNEVQNDWLDIAISDDGNYAIACADGRNLETSSDGGNYWVERQNSGARFWKAVCCSSDGRYMYARSNEALFRSTDYGSNWQELSAINWPSAGDMVCSSDGSIVYIVDNVNFRIWKSTNFGLNVLDSIPYGGGTVNSFAVSANGQKMVVGRGGGSYIIVSTDGGANWTDITSAGIAVNWRVAMSSDGTYLTAAYDGTANGYHLLRSTDGGTTWTGIRVLPGVVPLHETTQARMSGDGSTQIVYISSSTFLLLSTDYGATWTTIPKITQNPYASSSSLDGAKLYYITDGGVLYYSSNSGASWTEGKWFNEAGISSLIFMDCSDDGSRVYAAEFITDRLWRSSDSGATWTATNIGTAYPWQMVAASSTGQYVAVAAYNGGIFYSSDFGATYTDQLPSGSTQEWVSVSMSPDGTKLAAAAFDRVYRSANSGTTWTLVTTPTRSGNWRAIGINSDGTKLTLSHQANYPIYTSSDSGATWTERTGFGLHGVNQLRYTPTGDNILAATGDNGIMASYDGGATWTSGGSFGPINSVTKSSNGTLIIGAASLRSIIRSTDSAATFTEITVPDRQRWTSIACSSDGVKLAATVENGTIWTSTGGSVWTSTAAGFKAWRTISSSSMGAVLLAGVSGEFLYTSTNSGSTWTARTAAGSRSWRASAVSSTGVKMIAAAYGGSLWTSTDTGATWTERTGPGNQNWSSLASSSDGATLAATAYGGSIWTSTDSGATWTERTGAGTRNWVSVCCSTDGTKIAAAAYGGSIWTSSNTGADWTERAGTGSQNWSELRCSSTGSILIATVTNGGLWISRSSGARWSQIPESAYVDWRGLACSSDTRVVASTVYRGSPWLSGDYATSMRAVQETGFNTSISYFTGIQCSSDGRFVAAYTSNLNVNNDPSIVNAGEGYLWYSTDYGRNWSLAVLLGYKIFRGLAISDTGIFYASTVESPAATPTAGYLYKSTDNGLTWAKLTTAGAKLWSCIACSSDGSLVFATETPRNIYKSINGGTTWVQITSPPAPFGNWRSHQGFVYCREGNILYGLIVGANETEGGTRLFRSYDLGTTWVELFYIINSYLPCISANSKGDRVLYPNPERGGGYNTNYGNGQFIAPPGFSAMRTTFVISAFLDPETTRPSTSGNAIGCANANGCLTRWLGDSRPTGFGSAVFPGFICSAVSADGSYIFLGGGAESSSGSIYRFGPPLDSGWIVTRKLDTATGIVTKYNSKPVTDVLKIPFSEGEGTLEFRVSSVNDAGYSYPRLAI